MLGGASKRWSERSILRAPGGGGREAQSDGSRVLASVTGSRASACGTERFLRLSRLGCQAGGNAAARCLCIAVIAWISRLPAAVIIAASLFECTTYIPAVLNVPPISGQSASTKQSTPWTGVVVNPPAASTVRTRST